MHDERDMGRCRPPTGGTRISTRDLDASASERSSVSGIVDVGVQASREQRLDLLTERALDAWCELGPDGDGAAQEEPSEAFSVGVLERLAATTPRLVTMDLEVPVAAPAARPRKTRWLATITAAAAGVALALSLVAPDEGDAESNEAAAVLSSAGTQGTSSDAPALPEDDRGAFSLPSDFDSLVESYIAEYGRNYGPAFKFHGVVVVAKDGDIAYSRGFGTANPSGDPNSVDTRFRLGLLTEPITAVAIMQLVEQELVELDAPIARYLPAYPRGQQITIRDLLTHRSGIPNYTDELAFHTWKARPHTTDEMIERFAHLPLEFEPGSDTSPSNSNYFLLGAIIERVTGEAYADFVRRGQLEPAGMTSTTFGDAYDSGAQAEGNVWNDEEVLEPPDPIHMSTFGGAGGLVASPADLVAWDRALRDGLLVSRDALDQLSTPSSDGYGFGWVISRAYGQTLLSFPGAIDGYSGGMLRFQRDGTAIIVLANTEVVPGSVVAQDVAMMVYGDMPPKRNEPAEIDIAPRTHRKYVGMYSISNRTRAQYGHKFDESRFDLLARVYVESTGDRLYFDVPGHARTWMHPMGRNRFFFKDHSGNQVSFELGEDRRANKLIVHYQDAEFELDRVDLPPIPVSDDESSL